MTAPIVTRVGWATHAGLRRSLNEDALLAQAPLFLVADGMGGHEAGDRASAAVISELADLVGRPAVRPDEVRSAIARARSRVDELSGDGSGRAGTTLSGVAIASLDGAGYWLTVNIGDSRTYRFADNELEQITVDHSVVQELIEAGEIAAGDAQSDSRRNIITRALGAGSLSEVDYWMIPADTGDRLLVCSDGLSSEIPDSVIGDVLARVVDPQAAADQLIAQALQRGGRDNITAIVIDAVYVTTRRGTDDQGNDPDIDTRPRTEVFGGAR